jgi:alpha-tubulin suppressor-like RCC1 family protein
MKQYVNIRLSIALRIVVATILATFSLFLVGAPAANAMPFTQVKAGGRFTCGLTPSTEVKCWGLIYDFRLPSGIFSSSLGPELVNGLGSGVTAIDAKELTACAVVAGAAKCWGETNLGIANNLPVQVPGLTSGVTAISALGCAVVSGAAKCWGPNNLGQLGNGTTTDSAVATQVVGLTSGVTAISSGGRHACAIVNGAVKCWGSDYYGSLGDGLFAQSNVPVQVYGLTSGATVITTSSDFSCAIVNGAAKCWGKGNGRYGDGNYDTSSSIPVQVPGLTSGVTSISASNSYVCAVVNGAAKCWAFWNLLGELGTGVAQTAAAGIPEQVIGITSGATSITTGNNHTCATVSGKNRCWGDNDLGQLGVGEQYAYMTVPVETLQFGPNGTPRYDGVELVSGTSARIQWLDNSSDELGYLVYRVFNGTATLVPGCSTTTPNLTLCDDTGLIPNSYYQYYVYAWNSEGASKPISYLALKTASGAPAAPIAVTAVATAANSVQIGWIDQAPGETGFKIYRYLPNGTYTLEATTAANATTATITNAAINTANPSIFVVTAFNAFGETNDTGYVFTQARIAPVSGALAAPTYRPAMVTADSATISWTDNATNESGYLVYRVEGSTQTLIPGCSVSTPNLTTCTDSGLVPGGTYQFYVYAWNGSGAVSPGTSIVVKTPYPLPAPQITSAYPDRYLPFNGNFQEQGIVLTWIDAAYDETGYDIYEYTPSGYVLVQSTSANATRAVIRTTDTSTTHAYVVAAKRNGLVSFSNGIWTTTRPTT